MAYDDEIDPQRITKGMRDRLEAISYEAKDIEVLLDLAGDQVREIRDQLKNGITKFSGADFQATFSLLDIATREINRIVQVTEHFRDFDMKSYAVSEANDVR